MSFLMKDTRGWLVFGKTLKKSVIPRLKISKKISTLSDISKKRFIPQPTAVATFFGKRLILKLTLCINTI